MFFMNRISIRMELGENNRTKYGQYFMALFAKLNQDLSWHYTTDSYQCKLMPKGNLSETKKTNSYHTVRESSVFNSWIQFKLPTERITTEF